jgi:hypothetical protein
MTWEKADIYSYWVYNVLNKPWAGDRSRYLLGGEIVGKRF